MSERIEGRAFERLGRSCGFAAIMVACAVNALQDAPILAFKAGGLLSLIVTFVLMLLGGSRDEGTYYTTTRISRELDGRDRPAADRAQAALAGARRRAYQTYAYRFALAAAAILAVALAGDLNLMLHPAR